MDFTNPAKYLSKITRRGIIPHIINLSNTNLAKHASYNKFVKYKFSKTILRLFSKSHSNGIQVLTTFVPFDEKTKKYFKNRVTD